MHRLIHYIFNRQIGVWSSSLSGLFIFLLIGCQNSNEQQVKKNDSLQKIVCTTGMVADLVRQVAGPEIKVIALMGAGVDPHLFSASPQDVQLLAEADAIVFNGLHLEATLAGYLEKLAKKNPRVYAVADGITDRHQLIQVGDEVYDPHFWNDLRLWKQAAFGLADKLGQWEPTRKWEFAQRAESYVGQLDQALSQAREQIQQIPEQQRQLVTAHDAFQYLGRSLGIKVLAVQGISTNTEASIKKVEEMVASICDQKIPTLFAETSVNDKAIRAIIEGCQQRGCDVSMGKTLYSDSLGPTGSTAETFLGMYQSNVKSITEGLATPTAK